MSARTERNILIYATSGAEQLPQKAESVEDWENKFWSPRTLAHMRYEYSGKTPDGWGLMSYPEFIQTPYQIDIPVARSRKPSPEHRKNIYDELQGISAESLKDEPFNVFYRHMDMLITFDEQDKMREVAPVVLERTNAQGAAFAEELYEDTYSQNLIKRFINLRTTCYLETCAKDPKYKLPKETVRQIYNNGITSFGGFLSYAEEFDQRNAQDGQSIDVSGKVKEYLFPKLLSPEEEDYHAVDEAFTLADRKMLSGLLTYSLVRAEDAGEIYQILQKFAPRVGIENIRKRLREYTVDNTGFKPKLDIVFDYLGLDEGTEIAIDVGEVYAKSSVDMTHEYGPYRETLPTDLQVLEEQFQGLTNVVDNGCGSGRILLPLAEKTGLKVSGYDTYAPDIATIKNADTEADVRVGSWFTIPYDDKTFDAGYCLGRSLTHNTTIPDMVRSLAEMARVVKDDGFIIIDLPDPNVGEYKEYIDQTKQIAQERGLRDLVPGTIIDSPDGEHFFDRYVPDDRAFQALATFAGLHAIKLPITESYTGPTGKQNINTYWKVTKSQWPLPAYVRSYLYLEDILGHDLGPSAHPI